jgi:pentatricopeptide repeat protein
VDELSQEVAAIRESRAAIRRGDAKAALDALDRANVAAGPLDQEVQLAWISAYCLQGNVDKARSLAERLLQRSPDTLLASRVRNSCAFDQVKGR